MSLKAVFIDVGNTLLYEKPSRFEIYAESARKRGLELSAEAMQQLMRRAHREVPREVGQAFRYSDGWFDAYIALIFHQFLGLSSSEVPSIRRELFARFSNADTFALFPGGRELLRGLRQRGLRVGLISNWSPRLPLLLEHLDLAGAVDFVLCSAIERVEKPEALIFERALSRAGVQACEALHAGDDLDKDLRGARHAGLAAVLVDHFDLHSHASPSDVPRVRNLYELEAFVAALL